MEQSKETSSESNDYEIIDALTNTPEILSYTSSINPLSSPSEISDNLSPDNLSLTLSPLQNTTSPSSPIKSPLYQSILEGCEEAGITSESKPDKEEEKEEEEEKKTEILSPKHSKCILCRILQFIKFIFTYEHLPLTDDHYSSYYSHWDYI